MKPNPSSDPIHSLEQLAKTEAARRESDRERNRAAFPLLAGMLDMVRETYPEARLVGGIERGREIGRVDAWLRESYELAREK
jgi:hypothetical protein